MLRYLERALIKRGVNAVFARIINVIYVLIIIFSIGLTLSVVWEKNSLYRSWRDKIDPGNQKILGVLKLMEEAGESEENMILLVNSIWKDYFISEYTKPFQEVLVENGKLVYKQSPSFLEWAINKGELPYLLIGLPPIFAFPLICLTLTFLYNYIAKGSQQ